MLPALKNFKNHRGLEWAGADGPLYSFHLDHGRQKSRDLQWAPPQPPSRGCPRRFRWQVPTRSLFTPSRASAPMCWSCIRSAHRVLVSRFFFQEQTRTWDSAVSKGVLGFFLRLGLIRSSQLLRRASNTRITCRETFSPSGAVRPASQNHMFPSRLSLGEIWSRCGTVRGTASTIKKVISPSQVRGVKSLEIYELTM